jgi:hypothetical protein
MSAEPTEPFRLWWMRYYLFLVVCGLLTNALDLGLRSLSHEAPTPTPYTLPAHHAVYVHTAGGPTECGVDDGVTEPFLVSIPASSFVSLGGYRLDAGALDSVIAGCTAPTTVVIDPDFRYSLASNLPFRAMVLAVGSFGLSSGLIGATKVWILRRRRARRAATGGGSGSSPRRVTLRRVGRRLVLRR